MTRNWMLAAVLIICGAGLVAVALVTRQSAASSIQIELPDAATAIPADGQMKVYVAGAVVHPGVYAVHPGDRVADVVEAAGGPVDDADTERVNLAKRLRDEDRIVVPRRGAPSADADAGATPALVNINLASAQALDALPGIGPTRAQRIIESRQKDGAFAEPSDLVTRKLLPQSVYDAVKNLIEARP